MQFLVLQLALFDEVLCEEVDLAHERDIEWNELGRSLRRHGAKLVDDGLAQVSVPACDGDRGSLLGKGECGRSSDALCAAHNKHVATRQTRRCHSKKNYK